MTKTTVETLMTKDPARCRPDTTLNEAAHLMWVNDCGSLPVVASENGSTVVGMITDRDICMAAYHTGRRLAEVAVREAMSKKVFSAAPDDELADAARIMRTGMVRRVPVTDEDGGLQGVLTLAHLARAAENGAGAVGKGMLAEVLASISQPTRGARAERAEL